MEPEADRTRARSHFHPKTWLGRLALAALLLIPGLTGCGGGTDPGGGTGPGGDVGLGASGQVVIGLTDADGDFLTYAVDALSLRLTRSDGATVETVPVSTRVDFAQYVEVTEFLTAATVPVGTYTSATLTLDFSTADVQVEVDGVPVRAKVELAGGGTPGVMDVTINLAGDRPLKVIPGLPAHLVLDFDLAASNQVDLTEPTLPLVTVEPFLLADVDPADAKPHRLRGLLKKVNVEARLFQLRVLPLHLLRPPAPVPADPALAAAFKDGLVDNNKDGFPDQTDGLMDDNHDGRLDHEDGYGFGVFPVKTDDDTVFEIDGLPYVGDAGLQALARLPVGAPVVAIGDVNRAGRHMRAHQVRAGSSVPWGDKDVVTGVVTAREEDTLTVEGAAITFGDGVHGFRAEVQVLLGPDTQVTRLDVDPAILDKDAVSVGQRITAVGEFLPQIADAVAKDGTTDTAPSVYPIVPPILDGRNGHVRMLLSTLSGTVVEAGPGTLVVDVRAMNGRDVSRYDFTGTGGGEADDADPAAYEIDTGLLALDFVLAGDPVQVRGFVTPFGSAPPDFMARTVLEPALTIDGAALLEMTWDPATAIPFSEVAANGVTLDLTGAGERHHLAQRWRVTDLLTLPAPPVIAPPDDGAGSYAIRLDESLHIYFTFAGFARAVEDQLADGRVASRLVAHGEWDADLNTLTSKALALRMGTVTTDAEL